MKLEKPGANKKKAKKRTTRISTNNIEPPPEDERWCRRCGDEDGTEVYRHLETFRKYQIGKGTGTKSHAKFSAWLCSDCDNIMSNQRPDKSHTMAVLKHAEEWLWLICRTWLL